MSVCGVVVLNLCLLYTSTLVDGVANSSNIGYGYEMLSTKLEHLQYKLIEMDFAMKENRESIDQKLSTQATNADGLLWALDQLRQTLSHNLTALLTQSSKILSQQAACASHEQMRKDIQMIATKEARNQCSISKDAYRSCKAEPSKQTGKYFIQPTPNDEPFMVYCEQARFGGGWIVIQRRFDGSLDFYRNWTEYREGFGSIDREFWIGLEHLHRITSERPHELMVELEDFAGNYVYARYKEFEIGSEEEAYALKKISGYSGTAENSLTYHKNMKFSTFDRDNDHLPDASCAVKSKGAWWYNQCYYANLNAQYKEGVDSELIVWYHYRMSNLGMAYTRMMVRESS
ncbi:fibrinogen-like protein A [Anopheles maculipalpis]|uniref:fibrinogen-like protein A n=1 Tax=Anopheles maculipalpis TaxID=1496333 RepID=UPI002158E2C9|nr:fibrinogen-like protein A [Anopheles maculipalpis]